MGIIIRSIWISRTNDTTGALRKFDDYARHLCKNDHMDWQNLHVLAVLQSEGSLAGAARALGVNHATVSRRIAALEGELGQKLVRRLARSTPLTPKGQEIAFSARRMASEADQITRSAHAAKGTLTGRVRLSAPPAIASAIVIPALEKLREAHPALQIMLSASSQLASLDSGEADLAVRMIEPQGRQNIVRRIGAIPFALYARADIASQPPHQWRFIAFDETLEHVPQQQWLGMFAGDRPLDFLTGDFHSQLAAAEAGLGIALLPCAMVKGRESLVQVINEQPEPRPVWLVIHTDLKDAPAVRAVADLLISIMPGTD